MRLFEAAQTALTVDKYPRVEAAAFYAFEQIKCPPASAIATVTATPACLAVSIAVAIVCLAPVHGQALAVVTYM